MRRMIYMMRHVTSAAHTAQLTSNHASERRDVVVASASSIIRPSGQSVNLWSYFGVRHTCNSVHIIYILRTPDEQMGVGKDDLRRTLLEDEPQHASTERRRDSAFFLRNFRLFSVIASTNHALNYVVNSFSFALLSPFLGAVTLGLNWTLNSLSGLFVSTPTVKRLGFKRAVIISFWGYTIQILSLFFAVYFPDYAWTFGLIGAIIAGFTSAIWWTAQGVCFELSCAQIQRAARPPQHLEGPKHTACGMVRHPSCQRNGG